MRGEEMIPVLFIFRNPYSGFEEDVREVFVLLSSDLNSNIIIDPRVLGIRDEEIPFEYEIKEMRLVRREVNGVTGEINVLVVKLKIHKK